MSVALSDDAKISRMGDDRRWPPGQNRGMTDQTHSSERGLLGAVAASGLLWFVLIWVPQVDGPSVETATAHQIRSFLADNDTGIRLTATAGALLIPLVLVFAASLARLVRRRGEASALPEIILGAGVLVAVTQWIVVAASWMTLVQTLDGYDLAKVKDATLVGWYGLSNFAHLFGDLAMAGTATMVAAVSIASLRTRLLPRWISWVGITAAARRRDRHGRHHRRLEAARRRLGSSASSAASSGPRPSPPPAACDCAASPELLRITRSQEIQSDDTADPEPQSAAERAVAQSARPRGDCVRPRARAGATRARVEPEKGRLVSALAGD